MKSILVNIGLLVALAAAGFLGVELHGEKKVAAELRRINANQLATIERFEKISLTLHTEIRNTAVLGKISSAASVENYARQHAELVKQELLKLPLQVDSEVKPPMRR